MTYDVFISYSRKDTIIADRICATFDKAGISYFIDRQGIAGGMEFPKVLAPAIKESEVFLLLASENAYQSPFTTREVLYAFNKKRGEKMLPYIIDSSVLPDDLEFVFSSTNWRMMHEHPIESVLVDDVLKMLGRARRLVTTPSTPAPSRKYSQSEMEEIRRKAKECYDNKQYAEAIKYFRVDAEQGSVTAQALVGAIYYEQHDYAEALHWYRKAVEQGHVRAQFKVGYMYYMGYGVPRDHAEAMRWFRKAAEQGFAIAQYNLAMMYINGEGVTKDLNEARRWLQKAADQGYENAKKELQNM